MERRALFLLLIFSSFVFSGCLFDRSEISFGYHKSYDVTEIPPLHVRAYDGRVSYDFVLSDSKRSAGPFETRDSGTLVVTFVLLYEGKATGTLGSIELPNKPDWGWSLDFFIAEDNPYYTCFGCRGWDVYELDPVLRYDGSKKLWVVWGGNSISDPVVY